MLVNETHSRARAPAHLSAMSEADVWRSAPKGHRAPIEQAKLRGLRKALELLKQDPDEYSWMAKQVTKVGGGRPSEQSVAEFVERVGKDPQWHPGKRSDDVGRPTELTEEKRRAIAEMATTLKKEGGEPTYDVLVGKLPDETWNKSTGAPFSRPTINACLTSDCYDDTPADPWKFMSGRSASPSPASRSWNDTAGPNAYGKRTCRRGGSTTTLSGSTCATRSFPVARRRLRTRAGAQLPSGST